METKSQNPRTGGVKLWTELPASPILRRQVMVSPTLPEGHPRRFGDCPRDPGSWWGPLALCLPLRLSRSTLAAFVASVVLPLPLQPGNLALLHLVCLMWVPRVASISPHFSVMLTYVLFAKPPPESPVRAALCRDGLGPSTQTS